MSTVMDSKLTCEPCNHRNIFSRVSKYCTTCQELLCKDCAEVHKSCKATRTHLLVHIEDYKSSAKLSKELKVSQKCKEHKSKQIEFYCSNHRELLCSLCLLTKQNHRNCKSIVQLTSWGLDAKNRPFTDKVFNDLTKTILKAKYTQMKLEETLNKSLDQVENISDELNNIRDRFIALFDEQKNKIVKNAEEGFTKQKDRCNELLENIKESLTSAEKSESYLHEIINSGREPDMFHCIMLAIDKVDDLKKQVAETCQHSTIINITLEDSPFLQALEERTTFLNCRVEEMNIDISNVPLKTTSKDEFYELIISCNKETKNEDRFQKGYFKIVRRNSLEECRTHAVTNVLPENENVRPQTSSTVFDRTETMASATAKYVHKFENCSSNSTHLSRSKSTGHINFVSTLSVKNASKAPKHKITFEYSDKFDVSSVSGTDIWFGGIVCLFDDRVVLSDYLNKRLIILSSDHQIKETLPMKYGPGYLSLLGDDSILVCLMKTNQILLMKFIGQKIEGDAYLQTRFHPKCVQSINGEKVLVSMKDENEMWFMDILNNDGTIEDTIQLEGFYDGYQIAVQPFSDKDTRCFRIIQYCDVTDTLRCFKLDGEIVFSYEIDRVTCVLTDCKGYIFIVRHTGEVQVVSPEGKYTGHIHKAAMYKAKFSALSSSMDRIYITKYKSPTIHVLKVRRH